MYLAFLINRKALLIPLLTVILFFGCTNHAKQSEEPSFVLCLFNKNELPTSFLLVNNLDSSSHIIQEIALPSSQIGEREYIQKDGYFYRLSNENSVLTKYQIVSNKKLVAIDSVQIKSPYFETFTWMDNDNIIAVGREFNADNLSQAHVYQINTSEMKVVKEQTIVLPFATADFKALHVGLVDYIDGELWLAYSFFKLLGKYGYTTLDTTYYATIDFDTFKIKNIQTETRSTYPGGYNFIQPYSFKDEKGDYYFMTNPGVALGNIERMPTAIFRKNKGQHLVDTSYMINISEIVGNHAYGLWYVGDGKAVVRNEQKNLYTDFSDHHLVYQFEYQLVDLQTGHVEKIPVPLDKGTQKDNVWSDREHIYITIDDAQGEHYVWKYNIQTKETSKGLKLPNTTNFSVRVDYLK